MTVKLISAKAAKQLSKEAVEEQNRKARGYVLSRIEGACESGKTSVPIDFERTYDMARVFRSGLSEELKQQGYFISNDDREGVKGVIISWGEAND